MPCFSFKMRQIQFRWGSAPEPTGSLQHSPYPCRSGFGEGEGKLGAREGNIGGSGKGRERGDERKGKGKFFSGPLFFPDCKWVGHSNPGVPVPLSCPHSYSLILVCHAGLWYRRCERRRRVWRLSSAEWSNTTSVVITSTPSTTSDRRHMSSDWFDVTRRRLAPQVSLIELMHHTSYVRDW